MDDVEGGRIRTRREYVASKPQPRRCEREHTAELSAAEDADSRLGLERRQNCGHAMSFGASGTAAV
jgi:hypothetical protein